MTKPISIILALMMILLYTFAYAPVSYAEDKPQEVQVKIKLTDEQRGNIDTLMVKISYQGNVYDIDVNEGTYVGTQYKMDLPATIKDVKKALVQSVIINWKTGDPTTLDTRESATGGGTLNIFVAGDYASEPFLDLGVTKSVNSTTASVDRNSQVVFTITVTNHGDEAMNNVVVNDLLPAGLEFVSADVTTYVQSTGIWTVGTLNPDESATINITATVTADFGSSVTNTATVSDSRDANDGNNSASATVNVNQSLPTGFDIAIIKTVNNNSVYVGDQVTFTVTATNNGPEDAGIELLPQMASVSMSPESMQTSPGILIRDILPKGLEFVSATPSTGNYNEESGDWFIPFLGNGTSATLTMVAKAVETGTHRNTATLVNPDTTTGDTNDSDSVDVTVSTRGGPDRDDPEIRVVKEVSVDGGITWYDANTGDGPELPEGTVPKFRFTVKNTGDVRLTNVKLNDDRLTIPGLDDDQSTLSVNEEFSIIVDGVWTLGKHTNTATATGDYGRRTVKDTDIASFLGIAGETTTTDNEVPIGPAPGEDPVTLPDEDVTPIDDVPQTGEESNIPLLLGLMIASGAGIAVLGRRRRNDAE